ncbi:MAG: S41 family peptidase [Alphaproteobacteria bacterium]
MKNLKLFVKNIIFVFVALFVLASCQQASTVITGAVDKDFKQQYLVSSNRAELQKYFRSISSDKTAKKTMAVYDNNMVVIHYEYAKPVDLNKLTKYALIAAKKEKNIDTALDKSLKAAVKQLDPHSQWLNQQELKQLNENVQGKYVGIGVQVGEHPLGLVLQRVYENGPANKAGLRKGDVITKADTTLLKGKSIEQIVKLIKGKEHTSVQLRVLRAGVEKNYTAKRAKIEVEPVSASLKDGHVIYLQLDTFNERASKDLRQYFTKVQKQGGDRLILDLRSNSGGLLPEAIDVADMFLPKKVAITSTSKRYGEKGESWHSRKNDISGNMPMIVLVDEYTASASEIVAAALKDNGRAIIMGQRSFGKGTIQEVVPMSKAGALRLTYALYQSPKGHYIQAIGIVPNVDIHHKASKDVKRMEDLEKALMPPKRYVEKSQIRLNEGDCQKVEKDDAVLDCALQLFRDGKIRDFSLK